MGNVGGGGVGGMKNSLKFRVLTRPIPQREGHQPSCLSQMHKWVITMCLPKLLLWFLLGR